MNNPHHCDTSTAAAATAAVATRKLQRSVTFHDELVFGGGGGDDDNDLDNKNNKNNSKKKKHSRLILHRLIDQGPFRSLYLASDVTENHNRKRTLYAVKRIYCLDDLRWDECLREITVHRTVIAPNVMPLLDVKIVKIAIDEDRTDERDENTTKSIMAAAETTTATTTFAPWPCCCYLQFPYLPHSLGDDLTSRKLLRDTYESQRRPYPPAEALSLFEGILRGVEALHEAGFAHRDIKPDNILLRRRDPRLDLDRDTANANANANAMKGKKREKSSRRLGAGANIPVLADMGSAAPTAPRVPSTLESRNVMREDIERNTTVAYRAPELFPEHFIDDDDGYRDDDHDDDDTTFFVLHYDRADVWSLGCLLFAILYGASPFEVEWGISYVEGMEAEGSLRFVGSDDANALLENMAPGEPIPIPFPPLGTAADRRYGEGLGLSLKDLVRRMLVVDWRKRPSVHELLDVVVRMRNNEK